MLNGDGQDTTASQNVAAVALCCNYTCFGRRKKPMQLQRQATVWHDAEEDGHPELVRWSPGDDDDDESMVFFDAEEESLPEDEYPIITTSYIPKAPRFVSMSEPDTLLREAEPVDMPELPARPSPPSARRRRFGRQVTMEVKRHLEKPRVPVLERGYPGQLDLYELAQCQKFYHEIKDRPAMMEIVYCLRAVEEEPYSICRFMRGNKFDVDRTLKRLEEMIPWWEEAKAHDFYPDPGKYMGAPMPVFLRFYPMTYYGNAKNGCPVSYLKAGMINPEGLLSLTTTQHSSGYYWNQFMVTFSKSIKRAQQKDPDFVRCESICVIDLAGLRASSLNTDAMAVLKVSSRVGDYFPETLHSMLILNAPGWFSLSWKIIKSFIDPRTSKKIEVYSSKSHGQSRLLQLVDASEVPLDFGGTAPTTDSIMSQGCQSIDEQDVADDKGRWVVKAVHVKPKSARKLSDFCRLKEGESLSIQIYTRSISGISVSVWKGHDEAKPILKDFKVARASTLGYFSENPPTPYVTNVCQAEGPGTYSVRLQDLQDCTNRKLPHGYFTLVGRIVPAGRSSPLQKEYFR